MLGAQLVADSGTFADIFEDGCKLQRKNSIT